MKTLKLNKKFTDNINGLLLDQLNFLKTNPDDPNDIIILKQNGEIIKRPIIYYDEYKSGYLHYEYKNGEWDCYIE